MPAGLRTDRSRCKRHHLLAATFAKGGRTAIYGISANNRWREVMSESQASTSFSSLNA